jgi:hypothetical protein
MEHTNKNGDIIDVPSTLQASTGNNLYNKINDPIEAIKVMGAMIAESGMFGCTKHEQGMVLAMQCLAEGKAPLELAKTYHMVEGKLAMRADAMLGRFLTTGGKVKWSERTNDKVEAIFSHGDSGDVVISANLTEMKNIGVATDKTGKTLKQNWAKFPRQMLTARVISEGVRLLAPQLIAGVYTPEEVSDFSPSNVSIPVAPAPQVRVATKKDVIVIEEISQSSSDDVLGKSNARKELDGRLHDLLLIHEPRATNELIKLNYIKAGQTYTDLDPLSAVKLLDNPAKFLARIQ